MAECRVVQLIETTDLRGCGTPDSPYRRIRQWWTLEGQFVVDDDPLATPDDDPLATPSESAGRET